MKEIEKLRKELRKVFVKAIKDRDIPVKIDEGAWDKIGAQILRRCESKACTPPVEAVGVEDESTIEVDDSE